MSTPAELKLSPRLVPEITGILDCITEPAIALGTDYRILAANEAYRRRYGDAHPLDSRFCYEVSHHYSVPCNQAGESCPMANCLRSGQAQRVLHLHHTPRGEEHVDVQTRPIRDEQGQIKYVIEIMREINSASSHARPEGMVGRTTAFNRMLELIQRAAPADTAILLEGESGTGKELVAKAIHEASSRADKPFVVVECSGLTETLFESELFGHERGAFTGAHTRKIGLIESAEGGTLFLDEVGDIPLSLQVKLLRLLETGTYRRVGSTEPKQTDFRLITATHRDLEAMVESGDFRRDLYYRIGVFPIPLPALHERRDDLPLLIDSLLTRISPDRKLTLDKSALECLMNYPFPGNIRELRNILERAALLTDDNIIAPGHLPEHCCNRTMTAPIPQPQHEKNILSLEELEQRYLTDVVARFDGDKDRLAQKLGISKRTLFRKLQKISY